MSVAYPGLPILYDLLIPLAPANVLPTDEFIEKRGREVIASMITNVFYGTGMTMVVQYFSHHSNRDSKRTKLVVCLLALLATLETIFVNISCFNQFVVGFGDMEVWGKIHFSRLGMYTTIFATVFVSQIFYATRIWTLGQHFGRNWNRLAIPIVLFASIQISAGLAQVTVMAISGTFAELTKKSKHNTKIVAVQGSSSAICDVIIMISFLYILYSSRSGVRRTDSLLDTLITYAIQRGVATSVCSTLTVLLFYTARGTYSFMIPCSMNTQLHVISVISLLITRDDLREQIDRSFHISDLVLRTRTSEDRDERIVEESDRPKP